MSYKITYFCDKCKKPFKKEEVHDQLIWNYPNFNQRTMVQLCAPCRLELRKLVWNFLEVNK